MLSTNANTTPMACQRGAINFILQFYQAHDRPRGGANAAVDALPVTFFGNAAFDVTRVQRPAQKSAVVWRLAIAFPIYG